MANLGRRILGILGLASLPLGGITALPAQTPAPAAAPLDLQNPARAAKVLEQQPDNPRSLALAEELARTWTAQDASATRAWIASLPAGDLREMAFSGYLQQMVSTGWPEGLWEEISAEYPDPASAENILGGALLHYARLYPRSVPELLDELPDAWAQDGVWLGMLTGLGISDPEQARHFAEMKFADEERPEFLWAAARGWASVDAASALQWLRELEFSAEDFRPDAVDLFSDWASQDFAGLEKWLRTLGSEDDFWHDAALVALAHTAAVTNPSRAAELLEQLRDDEWRVEEAQVLADEQQSLGPPPTPLGKMPTSTHQAIPPAPAKATTDQEKSRAQYSNKALALSLIGLVFGGMAFSIALLLRGRKKRPNLS